jgi:hypothetical protein
VFYIGENKCHSRHRLRFSHATFHAPNSMKLKYNNVALELGVGSTIRSISAFKSPHEAAAEKAAYEMQASYSTINAPIAHSTVPTALVPTVTVTAPVTALVAAPPPTASVPAEQTAVETETKDMGDLPELMPRRDETKSDIDVTIQTSLELMKFLADHWDTHALSTTFFSLSSKDSSVNYKIKGKKGVVARLRIPAGFSIVATSEIHSGLISLNPHRLKHCSESADDQLLFRIVHQVHAKGLNMSRTSESWLKFATDAVKQIFN